MAIARNLFVNKGSSVLVRVGPVDESYALIVALTGPGTRYSMPIKDYDGGIFVRTYRPATEDDLTTDNLGEFRMPSDAPAEWFPREAEVELAVTDGGERITV